MRAVSAITPLLIQGPTASGKSLLAVRLAAMLDAWVVNVDSMQVYADLEVLTARPSKAQQEGVPHYLYGHVDGAERYGVGQWLVAVQQILADAARAQRRVIFCGGTGLYARALEHGLVDTPVITPSIRAEVQADYQRLGHDGMITHVLKRHPDALAHGPVVVDRQRLIRAAEVLYQTGKAMIAWHGHMSPPLIPKLMRLVVCPQREVLYTRINQRCHDMIDASCPEVTRLLARHLAVDLPLMRAIGVKTLAAYIANEIDHAAAHAEMALLTRRYAKRQLTWLRHQVCADMTNDDVINTANVDAICARIVDALPVD